MSADVESLPRNADVDDESTPEELNTLHVSDDDGDLFGDDDDEDVDQGNECETPLYHPGPFY